MMLPALLLAAAFGIVVASLLGRSPTQRIVRAIGGRSRPRRIAGSAAATAIAFGLSSLAALAVLGRVGALATMPEELRGLARRNGLAAAAGTGELWSMLAVVLSVAGVGTMLLWLMARRGLRLPGLRYRSPVAVRGPGDWPAATLVAVSAGVSEEAFFRLLLPLLLVIVTASDAVAAILPLIAFAALHRHQGGAGIAASAMVGAALFLVYCATGSLAAAMVLHILIDLNALIVRPWLERQVSS